MSRTVRINYLLSSDNSLVRIGQLKMKIKKNDAIKITVGKDKNKTGKVIKVFPDKGRILIEGLNLYKKHIRPKKEGEKGQTVLVPKPIDISNAMILCQSCGKAVRVGYAVKDGVKNRICKKCGAKI